ncbi:hypothetical protein WDZ92_31045, partial [Nostoc sp. NIES-2111]
YNNGDLLRQAQNRLGLDYTMDSLFKREFSDETWAGSKARTYEGWLNQSPILRVFGQMFFRTPVRVFEAAWRITPILQMTKPSFLKDLSGANGTRRQIVAQGEAMLTMGLTASILTSYANGNITGAGPSDPKQRKEWLAAGNKPYTIKYGDWEFNYRAYDPLATPIRLMVNTLDMIMELEHRKAQGVNVPETVYDEALSYMLGGMSVVMQTIKDANLVDGLATIVDAVDGNVDDGSGIWRWFKDQTKLLVPSTITKLRAASGGGEMLDPYTLWQAWQSRWNPTDPRVPRRYDALGNVIKDGNPWAALYGVDVRKVEEPKTRSEQVLRALSEIGIENNTNFVLSTKAPDGIGGDLRETYTADGKTTIYDAWQNRIGTKRLNGKTLEETLYERLVAAHKGSMGTPEGKGQREQIARDILKAYRDVAWNDLMKEQAELHAKLRQSARDQLNSQAGRKDATGMSPYTR